MDTRRWNRFRRNRGALVGLAIVILLVSFALLGPILGGHDGRVPDFATGRGPYGTPIGPSGRHWLGTDTIFRDVFVRLAEGGRLSMEVALLATTIAMGIGTAVGVVSGYFKGRRVRVDAIAEWAAWASAIIGGGLVAGAYAVVGWRVIGFAGWLVVVALVVRLLARAAMIVRGRWADLDVVDASDTILSVGVLAMIGARGAGVLGRHGFVVALIGAASIHAIARAAIGRRTTFLGAPTVDLDDATMRGVDVLLAFPFLLLLMAISAVVDRTTHVTIFLVLGLTAWTGTARVIRSKTLQVRELDYVLASRALGQSAWRILLRHVVPNVAGVAIILATNGVAAMIVAEAALAFLGLSVPPPAASWGRMLDEGRPYYSAAPWLLLAPALAIFLSVLGFNLLGEGLRDAFDPKDA